MSDISIIIMRDRGRSHSFRFSPTTFKIVISLLIIIPLLLVISIWFGLSIYGKYVAVLEETAGLRQSIEHNKQTVTRLANLERFLQKYSPDMLGLLVPTEDVDASNLPVIDGDKGVLMGELADSLTGAQMSFDIIEKAEQEKNTVEAVKEGVQAKKEEKAAETVKAEEKTEEDSAVAENGQAQTPETGEEQHTENAQEFIDKAQESTITQKVDSGFVEVGNFHARLSSQTINIHYQLINPGKKVQIEGRQKYYLCSQIDGKFALQELPNPTDNTFRIRNLKNVQSSASVAGMKIGEKAQLAVEIVMDNQVVFRQLYPITR